MTYNKFDKVFVSYLQILGTNTLFFNALELSIFELFDKYPVEASDGEVAREIYHYLRDRSNTVTLINWWKI